MSSTEDLGELMKAGMRRLASGVSVVTARDEQGEPYAMTASSITSLSAEPASLLVCVNQSAGICQVLQQDKAFAINILSKSQQEISNRCASGDGQDRFDLGSWQDDSQQVPILTDCEVSFSCSVDKLVDYGTHTIVIGKIQAIQVSEQAVEPLIYCNGAYLD